MRHGDGDGAELAFISVYAAWQALQEWNSQRRGQRNKAHNECDLGKVDRQFHMPESHLVSGDERFSAQT